MLRASARMCRTIPRPEGCAPVSGGIAPGRCRPTVSAGVRGPHRPNGHPADTLLARVAGSIGALLVTTLPGPAARERFSDCELGVEHAVLLQALHVGLRVPEQVDQDLAVVFP